jgi:DNA-binding beta-propeller fold protein YncE
MDTSILGGTWELAVDDKVNEVYIADGSLNRRLVVYDSISGAFKRGWGAYGVSLSEIENHSRPSAYDPLAPLLKQFEGPVTAVQISDDGLVYIADRIADRIQVFTKDGNFLQEFRVAPETRGRGSVWKLAFSHDPKQKYLLVADGENSVMWILDRLDGSVAGKFGHKGDSPGQFHNLYDIALDSNGNLYTGESDYNYRIQKFVLEGSP